MLGKLGLGVAMAVVLPMMAADFAEAKNRGDRDGARQGRGAGKLAKNTGKAERNKRNKVAKANKKNNKPFKVAKIRNQPRVTIVVKGGDYYGRRHFRPHRGFDRKCVAVGKRRYGAGGRIPGVRGVAFGPRSCRRAMRKCHRKLNRRQARGRNPFGACVVARRFR